MNSVTLSIATRTAHIAVSSIRKLVGSVVVTCSDQSSIYPLASGFFSLQVGYKYVLPISYVQLEPGPSGPDVYASLLWSSAGGCCLLCSILLIRVLLILRCSHELWG